MIGALWRCEGFEPLRLTACGLVALRARNSGPGAFYRCMSRTVNGERVFHDPEKEVLRRQLHQVAEVVRFS